MTVTIGKPSDFGISSRDVCNFYSENWPRKIALSEDKFYNWQFVNNSSNFGVDECCVAVTDDEIIGVMGLNSRDFYLSGKKKKGAELTTWVVSEKHRNKGSGPSMISYLKNTYEVMTGMGISLAALPVYLRSGFRYIKSIPRHVHVINWDAIENFVEGAPLAKKYARGQFISHKYKSGNVDDDFIDGINTSLSSRYNFFSRSSADVRWRYDQHPYFNYHTYSVNDNCHATVRIDRDIDGFVMAHCVDIFGDESSFASAVTSAIEYANAHGADAIDFFSTNATLNATMSAMGLFSTLDHDFFKFPHLFHPVEIRSPATTSLIVWSKNELCGMLDVSMLHITKQDADFDRPTIHGMKK
ncbi:GNAT family N-acetyltransferase [Yersinia ruckeri]|uniref:GNAT family N-acetyltransferase n=1 Tax=Yersinia ruckeri TaxID=29486 RepID=UPI002237B064|nr:GNAT family N-acetyltransferase [Yersinia ruckeri]MCW6569866.1 GNAT family N-acetyltransferase [Yersinia ruckeri]